MNEPMPRRPDRIAIVDDDARIRDLLRRYLTQEGFEVLLAEDGKALNRMLTRETIDLIVLDLMLPGEDGLSICRRLRASKDATPIIMLTAKVEDVDRIVGLEVGADDYMPKPFNPRELLARINAVLRRRPAMEAPGAPAREAMTVSFGPFEFDLALRRLEKQGEQIALTTGEFSMLKALVRHPRQPLSRDKLAQLARGREFALALWSAASSPAIVAAVGFYPALPWERMGVDWSGYQGKSAQIHCSQEDGTSAAEGIQQAWTGIGAAGGDIEVFDYAGTQHAFFNDQRPEVHDAEASALAWSRVLSLFHRRLAA